MTLHLLKILEFVLQGNRSHHFAASAFLGLGHLVGHRCCLGAGALGVFEGVDVAEPDLAGEVATLLEGRFCLTWEAHDDVGSEVEVGTEGLDAPAHLAELLGGIEAVHPFQGVFRSALEADVHVGCQLLVLEQLQETVAELVGFDGGDPDAEVALYINNVFHQGFKVGVAIVVSPHVDAGEHDFLEAMVDHFADVAVDVVGGTAG